MVNHKILYKIILVLGLLLTMILTLSLTQYSIAYAEDIQSTETENTENERLDFDSEILKQAREIIGNDNSLSNAQITALHELGFNDEQIPLLIEIIHDDTSINIDKPNNSSLSLLLYISLLFILLLTLCIPRKLFPKSHIFLPR